MFFIEIIIMKISLTSSNFLGDWGFGFGKPYPLIKNKLQLIYEINK